MPIRDLARATGVTHSAASQTVAELARQGLVDLRPGTDGRQRIVHLTDQARAILPTIEAEWDATASAADELDAELPFPLRELVPAVAAALDRRAFRDRILTSAWAREHPFFTAAVTAGRQAAPSPGPTRQHQPLNSHNRRITVPRPSRLLADVRPLRQSPAYRRMWAGTLVSSIGSMMTMFALSLQVYRLTHSAFAVGAIGLTSMIPTLSVCDLRRLAGRRRRPPQGWSWSPAAAWPPCPRCSPSRPSPACARSGSSTCWPPCRPRSRPSTTPPGAPSPPGCCPPRCCPPGWPSTSSPSRPRWSPGPPWPA